MTTEPHIPASDGHTVWILNHYAQLPGGVGGNTRHYSLGKYLKPHGWQSVVLAASDEAHAIVTGENKRLEVQDGVMFLWLKTPPYKGNGVGRFVNMVWFLWQAMHKKNTNMLPKPTVIIGSSSHPLAALAGKMLAKRYKVPFLYEVRDLWPQSLIDLGKITPRHPLATLFYWMERSCTKAAVRVLTVTPMMRNYFIPRGVPAENISWLPNGIDLHMFPTPAPKNDTDTFTYMYFGAHTLDNALDNMLHAMKILEARPDAGEIRLRLIGAGSRKAGLIKLAESLGLTRVSFEDAVAKLDIPQLAAQADAFVFSVVDADVTNKYGISPNKLFDFLAAGRPILYASSASNNPVAEADAGLSIASGSPEALADAMLQLANMPLAERQAMGRRGRAFVENNHSLNAIAAKLADILRAVTTKS